MMNLQGRFGGAEKRYISLFNHLAKVRDDYCLIINDSLYEFFCAEGLLKTSTNVFVIPLRLKPRIKGNRKGGGFEVPKDPVKLFLGRHKFLFKLFIYWLRFAWHFIGICRRNHIELVYGVWHGGIWSWLLCRWLNIQLVYSANSNHEWHICGAYWHFFDSQKWVLKNCDHIDFLSQGLVQEYEFRLGDLKPGTFSVCPNSFIDFANYYPVYPKNNKVVFMGRMVELKNPLLLLEAIVLFNRSFKNYREVHFLFIGEGSLLPKVKAFVAEYDIENVHVLGMQAHPWNFLRSSKIFVSIQQTENYPSQSLLEAMACDNVIIASDVGETRKLVSEKEGVLVGLEAGAISSALIELFEDEERCRQKGRNAGEKVNREHNIEKYCEYFFSITHG